VTGDQLAVATALCAFATVHFDQGDYAQARACLEERLARSAGVKALTKNNWWYISAGVALHEGRLDDAWALFHEAMALGERRDPVGP
jgi:hypothetical protein